MSGSLSAANAMQRRQTSSSTIAAHNKSSSSSSLSSKQNQQLIGGAVILIGLGSAYALYRYFTSTQSSSSSSLSTSRKQESNRSTHSSTKQARSTGQTTTDASTVPFSSSTRTNQVKSPVKSTNDKSTSSASSSTSSSSLASKSISDSSSSASSTSSSSATPAVIVRRPLVVCGPAGVGKGTLLARLVEDFPSSFTKSVSHTTRAPRKGEQHGVSYHYVTKQQFESMIAANEFIEYARVHDNYYGTSIAAVEHETRQPGSKICILEIDVQGCQQVNERTQLNPYNMFILPPSNNELKSRMEARGSETPESLAIRLETAEKELKFHQINKHMFHHSIVNDSLDQAYDEMKQAIVESYPHLKQRYSITNTNTATDPKHERLPSRMG